MDVGSMVLVLALVLVSIVAFAGIIALSMNAINGVSPEEPSGGERTERLRDTPRERAEALLRELLDEREYQQVRRRGYVDVVSPSNAQRIYRIPRFLGRVCIYEGGQVVGELCLQPVEPIPSADIIAMHKLMIQGDEEQYLTQANRFAALSPGQRYQP